MAELAKYRARRWPPPFSTRLPAIYFLDWLRDRAPLLAGAAWLVEAEHVAKCRVLRKRQWHWAYTKSEQREMDRVIGVQTEQLFQK